MLELQPVVFGKRLSCICTTQMQDYQKKEIVIMPFVNFCFKWLCFEGRFSGDKMLFFASVVFVSVILIHTITFIS